MKFRVTRTSMYDDDNAPCEEAIKELCIRIDERNVDDPMKNKYIGIKWYEEGSNHRVENGHIKRDFVDYAWFIEINSLKQLLEMKIKYGDIMISNSRLDEPHIIEIYDSWRK